MTPTRPAPTRPARASAVALACGAFLTSALVATTSLSPATAAPADPAVPVVSAAKLAPTTVSVPKEYRSGAFTKTRTVSVPAGWSVSVWMRRDAPRLMALAPDGRILVSRPDSGVVTRLTPHGTSRATSKTLIKGLKKPHGLAFDGATLYVAESNRIDSYRYADGKVGKRTTVLAGLPDASLKGLGGTYAHALKSVTVGPDHALYVSVGSSGNVSAGDRTADLERASVLRVVKGKATVFAHGVRNGTGLAVAPDGELWSAVNNRDNIAYPWDRDYDGDGSNDRGKVIGDYVDDHPLEPFAHLTQGRDLGWPYCNPDPDVTPGAKNSELRYANRPYVRDQQLDENGAKLDCSTLTPPEQGLPAHSAPLGLSFTTTALAGLGSGALVGVHGSWNRHPPRAPQVAFFSYANSTMGAQQSIMTGFQNADGDRWGRPVAAIQGADGALYVSDDLADAVYRLAPPA